MQNQNQILILNLDWASSLANTYNYNLQFSDDGCSSCLCPLHLVLHLDGTSANHEHLYRRLELDVTDESSFRA